MEAENQLKNLFRNILTRSAIANTNEESGKARMDFLRKAPEYMEAFPPVFGFLDRADQAKAEKQKGFLFWLHQRLSHFWVIKKDLGDAAVNVLAFHLNMLRCSEPHFFEEILDHHIHRLWECMITSEKFYKDESLVSVELKNWPQDQGEEEVQRFPLSFDHPDNLEDFQYHQTSLFNKVLNGINSTSPNLVPKLFKVTCKQLELCDMRLKKHSLSFLRSILDTHGWTLTQELSSYFCDVVFALIQYLEEIGGNLDVQNEIDAILKSVILNSNQKEREAFSKRFLLEVEAYYTPKVLAPSSDQNQLCGSLRKAVADCFGLYFEKSSNLGISIQKLSEYFCDRINAENLGAIERLIWLEIREQLTLVLADKANSGGILIEVAELSKVWKALSDHFMSTLSLHENVLKNLSVTKKVCQVAKKVFQRLVQLDEREIIELDFLSRSVVSRIVQQLIELIVQNPKEGNCFYLANSIISDILYFQPLETLTQQILSQCIAVSTIPWMKGEIKFHDLRLNEQVMQALAMASTDVNSEVAGDLLHSVIFTISSVQREVNPSWRTYVLKKAWSNGTKEVRLHILGQLPMILQCFGASSLCFIKRITENVLMGEQVEEIEVLSKIAGKIICVLSRQGCLLKEQDSTSVKCVKCDSLNRFRKTNEIQVQQDDVEFLLKLVGFPNPKAKNEVLFMIQPIAKHVGFSLSSITLWMSYFDDFQANCFSLFCRHVKYFFTPGWSNQEQIFETVMNQLKTVCQYAMISGSEPLINDVTKVICDLGEQNVKIVQEEIIELGVTMMLCQRTHASMNENGGRWIKSQIRFHRKVVLNKIGEILCAVDNFEEVLVSATVLFGNSSMKTFLLQQKSFILPHLTLHCARNQLFETKSPIEFIANKIGTKCRILLADHVTAIIPYLVVNCNTPEEYETCTKFLEQYTNLNLFDLVGGNRQRIITELLLTLHKSSTAVTKALGWIVENERKGEGDKCKRMISKHQILEFISPKFLGVLDHCDYKLNRADVGEKEKMEILTALLHMMEFMGSKRLTHVKHKLLATFKTSSNQKLEGFDHIVYQLWDKLIRILEPKVLLPILPQVAANAYQLFRSGNKNAIKIFEYIINDKGSELKSGLSDLSFIPEGNKAIDKVLGVIGSTDNNSRNTSLFSDALKRIMNSLNYDSTEVKILTLCKLMQFLFTSQAKLQDLIMNNEQVDPVINKLIELLIKTSRNSDQEVKAYVGRCLGNIGAVDPSRIEQNQDLTSGTNVSLSVHDEKFISQLLETLIKAFVNSADSSDSNACSYSLQEIIKTYKVKQDSSIWKNCSDFEREVLIPFFTSLYARTEKATPEVEFPIYRSKPSPTFHQWISKFSCHLMGQISEENNKAIFMACKAAMRKDSNVCEFLLPYIIGTLVCSSSHRAVKEIKIEINSILESEIEVGNNVGRKACQCVFSVIDHLKKWLRKRRAEIEAKFRNKNVQFSDKKSKDSEYVAVEAFLEDISEMKLASASFKCRSFARSLLHLENAIKDDSKMIQASLNQLQRISGALQEVDYIIGLESIREGNPTVEQQAFYLQSTGKLQDVIAYFESHNKIDVHSPTVLKNVIDCYLKLDCPYTAMVLVKASCNHDKNSSLAEEMRPYQMEAAWQLSQWDDIESCTNSKDHKNDWRTGLSKLLYNLRHGNKSKVVAIGDEMTVDCVSAIATSANDQRSYHTSYENMVKLQIMNEVNQVQAIQNWSFSTESLKNMFESWKRREFYVQSSSETADAILRVRRTLLNIMLSHCPESKPEVKGILRKELDNCLISTARIARESGLYQQSLNVLLEVSESRKEIFFLEKAKLTWTRGEKDEAISLLRKGINDNFAWYNENCNLKERCPESVEALGKAKILLAKYIDEAANLDAEKVPELYKEARKICSESEEVCYLLAKFFDKTYIGKVYNDSDLDTKGDIAFHIMTNYCRSLTYGCNFIDQSLPRLLSLWLDYGARVDSVYGDKSKLKLEMQGILKKMNTLLLNFCNICPTYYFLVVFPQLVSRICHPSNDVWSVLKAIMAKTFVAYPHQVFWHMVALSKSSVEMRRRRCTEILNQSKKNLGKFVADGMNLSDCLRKLGDDESVEVGEVSLNDVMPKLAALIKQSNFSCITIPTARNMTTILPSDQVYGQMEVSKHNPLPPNAAYIAHVEDKVETMRSLVKPKKITFRGSDGYKYPFLCKPKDDLRKDCRLVDLNNLLNKLFIKDSGCRSRDLRIRTYKVTPLSETSGIIEWVYNLETLRSIVGKLYKEKFGRSCLMTRQEMDKYKTNLDDPEGNRRHYNILIKRHPPVFSEWFKINFPDPQTWFLARLRYTRTTAVMSMVGYILGLGDRHAENILFDSTNGDTVHVDLNCIFNKGDTLRIPELVPFRLTRNMVEAMGPSGCEGPFRIACEKSLGLMRSEKDLLMASLRPFYFDPLLDWVQVSNKSKKVIGSTNANPKMLAIDTLKAIEARLEGLVSNKRGNNKSPNLNLLPLSVSGQVEHLIKEATSDDNLSQMFLGWASYY